LIWPHDGESGNNPDDEGFLRIHEVEEETFRSGTQENTGG
jgi:hypothetical protein